jgi:hypothetical protein
MGGTILSRYMSKKIFRPTGEGRAGGRAVDGGRSKGVFKICLHNLQKRWGHLYLIACPPTLIKWGACAPLPPRLRRPCDTYSLFCIQKVLCSTFVLHLQLCCKSYGYKSYLNQTLSCKLLISTITERSLAS